MRGVGTHDRGKRMCESPITKVNAARWRGFQHTTEKKKRDVSVLVQANINRFTHYVHKKGNAHEILTSGREKRNRTKKRSE